MGNDVEKQRRGPEQGADEIDDWTVCGTILGEEISRLIQQPDPLTIVGDALDWLQRELPEPPGDLSSWGEAIGQRIGKLMARPDALRILSRFAEWLSGRLPNIL